MMLQRSFANIISYLLHPIFLPTYAVIFLMWSNPYYFADIKSAMGITLLLRVGINSVVYPIILLAILKQVGLLKDLKLTERKERAIPFLLVIAFFYWTYLVVKQLSLSEVISDVMLGAFFSMMLAYFINVIYIKISMHTVGMGNFLAIILVASSFSIYGLGGVLSLFIIVAGLVGSSRLILGAHQPSEVYMGYFVGFIAQLVAFIV